jgi:NCS1 family nucleobase:cation symporter-1
MPVGSIVFVEHWIFPKLGLTQFWVSRKKLLVSWPALLSWGIAIAAALVLERTGVLHLFFLFVPVWLLTAVLYIIFASVAGAREKFNEQQEEQIPEKIAQKTTDNQIEQKGTGSKDTLLWISGIIAAASLLTCLILPIWVYVTAGREYSQNFTTFKNILIWPTLIYFITATYWAVKRNE